MLNGEVIWQASDSTLTKELRGKSITVHKSVIERVGESERERERLVACSNGASSKTDNFETRFISLSVCCLFSIIPVLFLSLFASVYISEYLLVRRGIGVTTFLNLILDRSNLHDIVWHWLHGFPRYTWLF